MRTFRVHAHATAAVLCSTTLVLTTVLATHPQNTTTTTSSPDACEPATCGGLRIAYPFWLGGTHPPVCGYQAFQVTCDAANGTASLKSSFFTYKILDIYYDESSLTVAKVGDGACDVDKLSVNASYDLGLTPFGISVTNQELFFRYNCTEFQSSQPPPPAWAPVSCAGGLGSNMSTTFSLYAWLAGGYGLDDTWRPVPGGCTVSMMPVTGYKGAAGKDYQRLMKGGFLLDYTEGDCAACVDSGGLCRINTTNDIFTCHCADSVSNLFVCASASN